MMAPQLKRAWASLIIGISFSAIVIGVVISYDPIRFLEDESLKKLVYGIIILGVALYGIVVLLFRTREKGMSVMIDERDHTIGTMAMKYQLWVRSAVLLFWMIALIETYEYQRSIPLVYPFFIFITTIISGALAQSLGIIIGYARGATNA
jgi:hypothetical protein